MKRTFFGTLPSGEPTHLYTLEDGEVSLSVLDYGAKIQSICAYGVEIVGGYNTIDGYLADTSHQGSTIGRVANRIAGAVLVMDGKKYKLPRNNGKNCLHGGSGFDTKLWTLADFGENYVTLAYTSADGEDGFPSLLEVKVTFTLKGGAVIIDYEARPDGKTPIALTNHSYFNLDGFGGTIDEHTATIYAERYTEVDEDLIPNGIRPDVRGTAFDFLTAHKIGERVGGDFIGYDHNFILSPVKYEKFSGKDLGLAAEVTNGALKLSVYTDRPGVQLYIGNFLGEKPTDPLFREKIKPIFHGAFCLEAQTEPDSVSHGEGFYEAGEVYTQTTVYKIEKL